nr:immunoglobulin light chain junction region [Macaca mulatta]MPN85218.1 immunoglobulin light chain junction region [Macaca mulatta]MPN85226.1 immunoglobulin light chain junction region [Macaca mulatta]MPN85241.1 immunoglobulin light chain junction region [Macaca mulatta]MPN85361.1 immunoglobulin light chain junction region [Macaca mulatta]
CSSYTRGSAFVLF